VDTYNQRIKNEDMAKSLNMYIQEKYMCQRKQLGRTLAGRVSLQELKGKSAKTLNANY
jgi:hypothetical protein